MQKRVVSSENREVNGQIYVVERNLRLEYNGEWLNDGYTIRNGEKSDYCINYPTDSDLKHLMENSN